MAERPGAGPLRGRGALSVSCGGGGDPERPGGGSEHTQPGSGRWAHGMERVEELLSGSCTPDSFKVHQNYPPYRTPAVWGPVSETWESWTLKLLKSKRSKEKFRRGALALFFP